MTTRARTILTVALSFTVGAGLGLTAGAWAGYRVRRSEILDFAMTSDARGIQRYVTTLEHLHAGDAEQAAETLEAWLDDMLISTMAADEPIPLSPSAAREVTLAFERARDYRTEHPRMSASGIDRMVANVFAQDGPRIR